ncbi:MAG: hypothetical protein FWD06_03675 [Oscillospiraceae bacterium]|nr:hypothetical protein [Oscillospiraceae bacterium]
MKQVKLKLNPAKSYQTIEGFGASGAWWAQFVGGWPDETRREIMRLLYHKEHGLGMQIYRYNLGGGSKESGNGRFDNLNRKASSFLKADSDDYDWSRDAEAVWCMKEAVANGADEVVLFVNSPPERWTKSGLTKGKYFLCANLPRKNELKFTTYMLDVTEHFLAQGLPVKVLSPINEPFGPWIDKLAGQEGCHYRAHGVRRLLRLFAREMDKRPVLDGMMLSGAEMNDLRYMNKTYTRAVLGDKTVRTRVDGIDVHGYVLKPLAWRKSKDVKRRFRKWMNRKYPGQPIRMSEWTEMQGGRDYGMQSALTLANEVWEDLTIMDVVSWQKWIAVSEVDYSDGLIYVDQEKQTYDIPKRYYAYGQFTKFVPRGAQRIEIKGVPDELQAVAFNCGTHTAVIFINHTSSAMAISLGNGSAQLIETNEEKSLHRSEIDLAGFSIAAKSVNTVVIRA